MATGIETRFIELLNDPEAMALQADLAQAAALRRQEQAHRQRLGAAAARRRRAEELGLTEEEIAEAKADVSRRRERLAATMQRAEAADLRRPVPDRDRAQVFARFDGKPEAAPATLAALDAEGEVLARAAANEANSAHLAVEGTLKDVTLQVSDARGRVLYRTETLVTIPVGTIQYLEVSLKEPDPEPGPVPGVPRMPDLVGQSERVALTLLKRIGVSEPKVADRVEDGPPNIVLAQKPEPGTELAKGTKVSLEVRRARKGGQIRFMPGLIGTKQEEAERRLKALELKVAITLKVDSGPEGIVLDQDPKEGAPLEDITQAGLVISTRPEGGADRIRVPDLIGKTLAEATEILFALELKVKTREVQEAGKPAGVTAQTPDAGTVVGKGSSVALEVNSPPVTPPSLVILPSVIGQQRRTATKRLRELGLEVGAEELASPNPKGEVLEQDPEAGARLEKGTIVTLRYSTGAQEDGRADLMQVITAMARDPRAEKAGLTRVDIAKLFRAGRVEDVASARALSQRPDDEIQEALSLPTKTAAKRFGVILRKALKDLGR